MPNTSFHPAPPMEMAAIRLIQIVTVDGKMDLLHIVLLNLQ